MNRRYCRVSTQEQGKEGISLQMQEHTIKNYLHHRPVQIYQDVGTGRNCKRTKLQQLLKDLVEGDKVIIYKLSRLSRSLTDLWKMATHFKKMGVDFVSCSDSIDTSSANGRMVFKNWVR